ncbi:MAG TPA: hypothetical protein VJV74_03220, partial [Terriglobia bacterium]|nr:hypothetical protein [Terriglobia bacterium]
MEQFFTNTIRRYYELELPHRHRAQGHSRKRWPLLIALHGYEGDMTSMMRVAQRIGHGKMIVIALQGPNQFLIGNDPLKHHRIGYGWGTTWKMEDSIALHHADLRALIDLTVRRYHAERTQVFLLAFSQACT